MTGEDAALYYVAIGWRVVPLHSITAAGGCTCGHEGCGRDAGKHPLISGWVRDATTDVRRIREWWGKWPWANVGVAAGAESRLVVLDVDVKPNANVDGHESLRIVEREVGELPDGPLDRRGEGQGEHRFFEHPAGICIPGRKRGDLGMELLSDGQLVVVPPSNHFSGGVREWASGRPRREDLAPLPDAWVEWFSLKEATTSNVGAQQRLCDLPSSRRRIRRARKYVRTLPPSVSGEGGRAALMTAVGAVVRGFCVVGDDAVAVINDDFNPRCTDAESGAPYPWTEDELRAAVENATTSSTHSWGNLLTRRRRPNRRWPEDQLGSPTGRPRNPEDAAS